MPASHPIPKVVKLDPEIKDRLERLGHVKRRSTHWLMKEQSFAILNKKNTTTS